MEIPNGSKRNQSGASRLVRDSLEHFPNPGELKLVSLLPRTKGVRSFFGGRRGAVNETNVNSKHSDVSVKPSASETPGLKLKTKCVSMC